MKKGRKFKALVAIMLAAVCSVTATMTACVNGEDGKSAYEIWLEAGHEGTQEDFLEWLKGENGAAGEDGKSAYEIWLEAGHVGTVNDFLEWLKGEDGAAGEDGKSAYEIWLEAGHVGTEEDFLEWLKGEVDPVDENNRLAYEIWLEAGHTGTVNDFIEWLKVEVNSTGGNSAYEIWLGAGYKGTSDDFIEWLTDYVNESEEIAPPIEITRDPETDALKLAIGPVEQNFNPLFYTAQNDGEIANMTQASLVTSKVVNNGSDQIAVLAYGNDQPTFALDYLETYYDASGRAIGYGNGDGNVTGRSSTTGSTTYEFVIKKGVKDSRGVEMNVMDVLFNLYTLLDSSYTGTSTLYSTKIKGLQAYRLQDPFATEDATEDNSEYYALAEKRIQALIDWSEGGGGIDKLSEDQKADLEKVKDLYKDELTSDWNIVQTSWAESYKDYTFTEEWQAFMYIEGVVQRQAYTNAQGGTSYKTNADGKYLTSLDPDTAMGGDILHQNLIDKVAAATAGLTNEFEIVEAKKEYCINQVYTSNTIDTQIDYILTYCNTAGTALEYFMADEHSKAYDDKFENGQLVVPSISGITVRRASSLTNEYNNQTTDYGEDYDILRIEIDGVDPRARWNFGIAVTPMHYYSDAVHYNAAMAAYNSGKLYDNTCIDFGVEFNDINWFNDVVAADYKEAVPVGAGAYKAVNNDYSDITMSQIESGKATFCYGNLLHFARNGNFTTFGDGVDNAIINRVQVKVMCDSRIADALKSGEIDYGELAATSSNLSTFSDKFNKITYLSGAYGYVGINPKYVPDIEVRQAIMHVFDTGMIEDYYGSSFVTVIDRPVSSTSWAYPEDASKYYAQWTDPQQVIDLIESSGNWYYDDADGKLKGVADDQPLKLTFTIAGENADHPANLMFNRAKEFLAECGIKVTVQHNSLAYQNLVTGDLAVWAAERPSMCDPDLYQIYSINSQAPDTKNWYKDGILNDETGNFAYEQGLAYELSELIDDGRSTLNQNDRKAIYKECYDIIMELAVEFPAYQRYELCVYNSNVLDETTIGANCSYLAGPIDELWKLEYVK